MSHPGAPGRQIQNRRHTFVLRQDWEDPTVVEETKDPTDCRGTSEVELINADCTEEIKGDWLTDLALSY